MDTALFVSASKAGKGCGSGGDSKSKSERRGPLFKCNEALIEKRRKRGWLARDDVFKQGMTVLVVDMMFLGKIVRL